MKRFLILFCLFTMAAGLTAGERHMISRYNRLTGQTVAYPEVSIQYIQEVAHDSLIVADALQNTVPARWTLQTSDHNLDTVVVTALCLVPGKVITFTNKGYTMLLADTGANAPFHAILCRASSDTARPWITFVPWPVTEAWLIERTGR